MANGTNESHRGPQIINETADRTMIYYLVSRVELKSLRLYSLHMTASFSILGGALGFGLESYREYDISGNSDALPWVFACVLVGIVGLVFAALSTYNWFNVQRDIESGKDK